jgi:hypothetical protein
VFGAFLFQDRFVEPGKRFQCCDHFVAEKGGPASGLDFLGGRKSDRRMGNNLDIDELRRLERVCLEQAEEAATPEGRAALLQLAANYRAEADRTGGNTRKN